MVQLCFSGGEFVPRILYKSIMGKGISANQTDSSSNKKKVDDHFFMIRVTALFDQMQHLRIEQTYMPNIHKTRKVNVSD